MVTPGGPVLAALWAAGAVAEPAGPGEAELAVDLGVDRTHACVVSEGRCLFARTFASGSSTLLRALARGSGRNPDEVVVDEGLPSWVASPGGEAALRSALVPLVRELRATLHAFEARPSRRPVVRVRLAGGAAAWPGLAPAVGEELGIPAELLRLSGPAADAIPAEDAPRFALPLALALRGWLGNRFQRLNLRRGDLASTRSTQDVRARLQRLAVYASLVLLLAVVSSVVRVVALNRQEKLLDRSMCEVTQRVVGKCFDDFAMAESVLRGRGTVGASIPRVSAAGVLAELAARIPRRAAPLRPHRDHPGEAPPPGDHRRRGERRQDRRRRCAARAASATPAPAARASGAPSRSSSSRWTPTSPARAPPAPGGKG